MEYISPILETERLILRPLTLDDADAVFAWAGDPEVPKYMNYPVHTSTDVTCQWLSTLYMTENDYQWGYVRKSDGLLIGSDGIKINENGEWEFGYNLRRDCWNQGYCTEATKRMIDFAIENHDISRIIGRFAVDNPASGRVMEKCGLVYECETEVSKIDGSETFKAKQYVLILKKGDQYDKTHSYV